jgi:hypothetical protein
MTTVNGSSEDDCELPENVVEKRRRMQRRMEGRIFMGGGI